MAESEFDSSQKMERGGMLVRGVDGRHLHEETGDDGLCEKYRIRAFRPPQTTTHSPVPIVISVIETLRMNQACSTIRIRNFDEDRPCSFVWPKKINSLGSAAARFASLVFFPRVGNCAIWRKAQTGVENVRAKTANSH
jgi:hypothetical protein